MAQAGTADRDQATKRVIEGLKQIYRQVILPLEQMYMYDSFYSPALSDSEFDSKPIVLLVGQYSTGKTSFIRYLIGRDFPGQRIGPEPTTDRFVAVMDGPEERVIPGNALAVAGNMPFRGLDRFGVSFLNKFEGSVCPSPVLRNINIVDTPGVLAGNKQTVARGYEFTNVCGWFAERADLILLLFDAHKLDISDEFKEVIEKLRGHDDKIRCVLNKADQVDRQKLMRVYGALMWSMGKVMRTPEVLRVYVGSFWDQPLMYTDNKDLFEMEERDLMKDLRELPRNSAMRKINELVKRTRLLRVHACLIGYLKEQMPMFMGREKMQERLLKDLPTVFRTVLKQHSLAPGDFPDIDIFRNKLLDLNFSKFPKLKTKLLQDLTHILETQIPHLMNMLPKTSEDMVDEAGHQVSYNVPVPQRQYMASTGMGGGAAQQAWNVDEPATTPTYVPEPPPQPPVRRGSGTVQAQARGPAPPVPAPRPAPPPKPAHTAAPPASEPLDGSASNPFADDDDPFASPNQQQQDWALAARVEELRPTFETYGPVDGKLPGGAAKTALVDTGVEKKILKNLWNLVDIDKDGMLDLEEYVLAMQLIDEYKVSGVQPEAVPPEYIPLSKK